jgi:hypothetical protein
VDVRPAPLEPGKTVVLNRRAGVAEPKLWWPRPNPDLYRLRTTLRDGDQVVDVHEQLFGFREVTLDGTGLYINGVRRNFWNWVDVSADTISSPRIGPSRGGPTATASSVSAATCGSRGCCRRASSGWNSSTGRASPAGCVR